MQTFEQHPAPDLYHDIAERYDLFDRPFGEHDPDEFAFFRRLINEHKLVNVLDCACGTGRHLHLLKALGCHVVGSDLSPAMLDRARQNLASVGMETPLHQVDYRHLPERFDVPFDAVLCLSSSILHVPDEVQLRRAFSSMRKVLRPGGILVMTQGTTDCQWSEKPRFILSRNSAGFTRLFVIDYHGQGACYNLLDIWHEGERREMKVWSVDYPRLFFRDDQVEALKEVGFRRVASYGSYDLAPYDVESSGRLILIAER